MPSSTSSQMPGLLSPERETEIRERAEAATEGPWAADGAEIYRAPNGIIRISQWVGETLDIDDRGRSNRDAEFVAHAREDVPALLAEIDRLRAEIEQRKLNVELANARHRIAFDRASRQRVARKRAEAELAEVVTRAAKQLPQVWRSAAKMARELTHCSVEEVAKKFDRMAEASERDGGAR